MTAQEQSVTVTRDDAKARYEIRVGGELAGFTVFEVDPQGRLAFPHTEIDPAFSGRGLGSILVGEAMADAAARHEAVVPLCPFVVKYVQTHEVPGLEVVSAEG